jgi:replicative DNA helicase
LSSNWGRPAGGSARGNGSASGLRGAPPAALPAYPVVSAREAPPLPSPPSLPAADPSLMSPDPWPIVSAAPWPPAGDPMHDSTSIADTPAFNSDGADAPIPVPGLSSVRDTPAFDPGVDYAPIPEPLPAAGGWRVNVAGTTMEPRSALDVVSRLDAKVASGEVAEYQPIALGFTPLDKSLGGGIRGGELVLLGGAQGTGKTTMSLQIARNIALAGQADVLYVCFEHDDEYLLNRLIALESAIDGLPQPAGAIKLNEVRKEILATWMAQEGGERADLMMNPKLRGPLERIGRYGQSLFMMRGSQTLSTLENLHRLVEEHRRAAPDRALVLFVDYLQKVPVIPDPATETDRVTVVVNGLKDLALTHGVGVVSIVAADKDGLKASRLRNHHLRGSSAINYEADVILILNEKYNIVAKVNIEFNPYQAQRFRDWIVLTVEKNRSGQHSVDFEFYKHFAFACFDPSGRNVQEKLIEERLYND